MIRVLSWIDMSNGPTIFEATRHADDPTKWSLMRLDVSKQRDPDSVPGELLLQGVGLSDVYGFMQPEIDRLDGDGEHDPILPRSLRRLSDPA